MFRYDFSQWPKTLYNTDVYKINSTNCTLHGNISRSLVDVIVLRWLWYYDDATLSVNHTGQTKVCLSTAVSNLRPLESLPKYPPVLPHAQTVLPHTVRVKFIRLPCVVYTHHLPAWSNIIILHRNVESITSSTLALYIYHRYSFLEKYNSVQEKLSCARSEFCLSHCQLHSFLNYIHTLRSGFFEIRSELAEWLPILLHLWYSTRDVSKSFWRNLAYVTSSCKGRSEIDFATILELHWKLEHI